MRGGPVPRGETLAGDDECSRVGTKVEEELRQDVDGQQSVLTQLVVGESHDDEEHGQDTKAHQLDGLTAQSIDSGHSHPVARDSTSQDNDQVANGCVVQVVVGGLGSGRGVTDGGEDLKNREC